MVLPPSHKIPRVSCYSGYRPLCLNFAYGNITLCVGSFPSAFSSPPQSLCRSIPRVLLLDPGLGSFAFARHYLRNHCCFLFLWVLRCFSSPRYPLCAMDLRISDRASVSAGFPHSEIRVSSAICAYTRLIAACHVLHRLLVPGHPPYALSSLTFSESFLILRASSFLNYTFALFDLHPSKIELILRVLHNL